MPVPAPTVLWLSAEPAAGEIGAVEAVAGQDAAGDIAAHAGEAVHEDRLALVQLAQPRAQLVQRDVHRPPRKVLRQVLLSIPW